MGNKFLELLTLLYRKRKSRHERLRTDHPDEQDLASLAQGTLPQDRARRLMEHIVVCASCAENFAFSLKVAEAPNQNLPVELLERISSILSVENNTDSWQIVLRLKEKAMEIINTAGDVLIGQELVPMPLLRSRSIDQFKDEVVILKDFRDRRVEVRIQNKRGKSFDLTITAKNKQTNKPIKDLRATLIQDDVELESYLADSGAVIFEHVQLGKYNIEISSVDGKLTSIMLDIKT
jgi:hypothetical protein